MLLASSVTLFCAGDPLPGADLPDLATISVAAPTGDRWEFSITPYLWTFGMDGDLRIRNTSAEVDASFSDILENLDIAALLELEARRGRFGIYADSVYGQLSAEGKSGPVTVDVKTDLFLLDFGALYSVMQRRTESGLERVADVTIGGRYLYTDNEFDFAVLPDQGKSTDFIDLTVGGRYRMDVTDRFGFLVGGDVGGFGLGSSSELSWAVEGLLSWSFGKSGRLWGGYRMLDIDQDDGGSSGYDLTISGPLIGYEFRL